jgi:hypothetical protein
VAVVELDYTELGVAWQRSRLPALPVIFTWRNHATAPDDPQHALHEAEDRLRARGMIDRRGGLDDDLYGALALFAHAPAEINLRFAPAAGREIRASVAARGGYAVRAILNDDLVRVETGPADPPHRGELADRRAGRRRPRRERSRRRLRSGLHGGPAVAGLRSDDARNLVSLLGDGRTRLRGRRWSTT